MGENMRTYPHLVAGETVRVYVPEDAMDLDIFLDWVRAAAKLGPISLDTETTGLDIYSPGYRLRMVQFGTRDTAYVIHWERGGRFVQAALTALHNVHRFQIHNAPFDWLVLDKHAGIPLESLAPRTTDTQVLAKLIDPRQPQEGGIGSALKPLSAHYIDPAAPDTQGDLTAVFHTLGLTKETGWAGTPLEHPIFNLYAGLDVILTARLAPRLIASLDHLGVRPELRQYEHEIARICAHMQRRGMVLDAGYTQGLDATLAAESEEFARVAARYGVENVNSTKMIAEALAGMGETLTERTASGAVKVDKAVLLLLADMDLQWKRLGARKPNPLAEAVLRSKRAGKWRTTYVRTFLNSADAAGRVHPNIQSLAARTGRMSVTGPALQTLPSGDWMIRRCLLAEEGHVMISTDFQAIEMRVLAALADVRKMKHGFQNADSYPKEEYPDGFDIHMYTARLIKGPNATKGQRKTFKGAGFGQIYGGGAATIARQTGAPIEEIQQAISAYDREFPEIKRASRCWQREAYQGGMVFVSATGRRLPLDRDRAYAVVNYACQSVARDCLGQALLHIEEAGLLDALRLPIHDEVLASVPKSDAADVAREIERCMTFDLFDVPIVAEAEIGGRSWGSLYGADF
jgi:DNA polymerase-1